MVSMTKRSTPPAQKAPDLLLEDINRLFKHQVAERLAQNVLSS